MRVALVIYTFSESHGGVERYAVGFSRELVRRGHEVHVVCAHVRPGRVPEGVQVHAVPVTTWYSPLRYTSFARNAAEFLAGESFDVVHGFGRTYAQDICRVGGGAHWEYLLNTDPSMGSAFGRLMRRLNPRDRLILGLERRCYAPGAYRKIVSVSKRCAGELQRYFSIPERDITVIHNAVDATRFTPAVRERTRGRVREMFGVRPDDLLALFVGTGFKRKGLRYAIEALALVPRDVPLRLMVIGRGPVGAYRRYANRLKLQERVYFLGERDPITDFYGAADVFMLPTLYDPFPNVCLEAMACGLPVITSAMAGASEVMRDGVDGFVLQEPRDAMAMAGCLRRLAEPARRAAMGRAARETAERNTTQVNYDRNLALYDEVAAMKKGARS